MVDIRLLAVGFGIGFLLAGLLTYLAIWHTWERKGGNNAKKKSKKA